MPREALQADYIIWESERGTACPQRPNHVGTPDEHAAQTHPVCPGIQAARRPAQVSSGETSHPTPCPGPAVSGPDVNHRTAAVS